MVENGQLPERKLKEIPSNCQDYILQIGKSFLKRYPESEFILSHCKFIDPATRAMRSKSSVSRVAERFDNNTFNMPILLRQYKLYTMDDELDDLYGQADFNPTKFFCHLYNNPAYREFARLALLLMTISPDTCDLERGFSTMNSIKSSNRSTLLQSHLTASMRIALGPRYVSDFSFSQCLK